MSRKNKAQTEKMYKWGSDYVTKSDHSRLEQAKNNYEKLPLELQNKFFLSLTDTANFYPEKKEWSDYELQRLKLFWNKMPTDWMCDHFHCSHTSLVDQAYVKGLHPINDGQSVTSEDLDLVASLQDGGMSIKKIAELFGMEYDFAETAVTTIEQREVINMEQQSLLGDND